MLRYALPAFRLPGSFLDHEIKQLQSLGVKFQFRRTLGRDLTLAGLRDMHDAVYVAVGAQKGMGLMLKGEDSKGVTSALEFLKKITSGARVAVGKRVAVIGGGFTAVDSARTALRLGAKEVYILYRRTKEEMPASAEEIAEAEEEGIKIMYLVTPQKINAVQGKVASITMINQVLGEADTSGRRRPIPVEEAEFTLPVEQIIVAIGQAVDLPGVKGLKYSPKGATLQADKNGATAIAGVFAGGDAVHGASTVIAAIAAAKTAAAAIDRYLLETHATLKPMPHRPRVNLEQVLTRNGADARQWRVPLLLTPARERAKSFKTYTPALAEREAIQEASRCYRCGCGEGCMICHDICKMFAYHKEGPKVVLDEDKCVACGMCIWRCPNDNITMIKTSKTPI
jgi:formate dehydrogenase major subunit